MAITRKKISELTATDAAALTEATEVVIVLSGVTKKTTLGNLRSFIGQTAQSYTHVQPDAAMTWAIAHGLGSAPGGVNAVDTDGNNLMGIVTHVNANLTTIDFSQPIAGEAVLS